MNQNDDDARWSREALDYKPGDFLTMRNECLGRIPWAKNWIAMHGPGPYLILKHSQRCNSVLLSRPDGSIIRDNPSAPINDDGHWIFGKFFTRNNFLGLVHKAIKCNYLKSEP